MKPLEAKANSRTRSILARLALREAVLQAADAHCQQNHLETARDLLGLLEHCHAHTPQTLQIFGNLSCVLGDYELAGTAYGQAVSQIPDNAALWLGLALTGLHLNDATTFEEALQRTLTLEPENPDALKLLADQQLKQENYRDAAITYGKVIARHPDQAELFLSLARCFAGLGDRATAYSALERALELDPQNQTARENVARLQQNLPLVGAAQQATASASPRPDAPPTPPSAAPLLAEADAAYARGDLTAAAASIEQALQLNPRAIELHLCLGNIQFQLGQYTDALEAYRQANSLAPKNIDVLIRLAMAAQRCANSQVFGLTLQRVLQLEPDNSQALRLRGDTDYQAGRYADASASYLQLLDQAPNDPDVLLRLGNCRAKLDQLPAARDCFTHVLLLDPKNTLAQENLEALKESAVPAPAAAHPQHHDSTPNGHTPNPPRFENNLRVLVRD